MRKELLFAVAIGSVLGLMVAFGVWRANGALSSKAQDTKTPTSTPKPNNQTASTLGQTANLTIVSPSDEEVFSSAEVEIKGITKASSFVLISTSDTEYFTKADSGGNFVQKVTLGGGLNPMAITTLPTDAAPSQKLMTLVFSTEVTAPEENTQTSSSSDSIRLKVQQKLDEVEKRALAYLGIATDKTETGIQIKTNSGEIKQAAITPGKTTFVRIGKTNKVTDFADLGIGDYVAALGYKNGLGLLTASRVLITTPEPLKIKVAKAQTTESTRRNVTVSSDQNSISILSTTKADIYKVSEDGSLTDATFKDLQNSQEMIISGNEADPFVPFYIYILKSSNPSPTPR